MRYVWLEQGSTPWLVWRAGGIGASDAPVILRVSPFKTRERLFAELTGQVEPEVANYAMRRGTRKEPEARAAYIDRHGVLVDPCCGEHDEFTWLRASFDGLDFTGELALEIKWPNHEAHAEALEGYVPDYYWPQVQQQLLVSGARVCHYWSCTEHSRFSLEERYALVEVRPDPDYHALLLEELGKFWREVEAWRRKER